MGNLPVIFVFNLLQDVNILRPLVSIAALILGRKVTLLVSDQFKKRDASGIWQQELNEISNETGAGQAVFADGFEALRSLKDGPGYLVAASESHLPAHKVVHDLFRIAPSGWLRITLQHGFECVGFLQSREHNIEHGAEINFAADVICGWSDAERLTAVASSERHKVYVTGPTSVLQRPAEEFPINAGIVCENLHSPRLSATEGLKYGFLKIFGEFCAELATKGERVALRPHPGGQYFLKNGIDIPADVIIENRPIYKVDLGKYSYGISAPSSMLIDMVMADIPVAVWQGDVATLDLSNYNGLERVSTADQWIRFARDATERPERYLDRQRQFLRDQRLVTEPQAVQERYATLLHSASPTPQPLHPLSDRQERILFIANGMLPTLQLCFLKPLKSLVESGEIKQDFLTETELNRRFGKAVDGEVARKWVCERVRKFRPTIMVFCRYSGPHWLALLGCAAELGISSIYHIDDDLLHIPENIGLEKFKFHNRPERLSAVRGLLEGVDLVYASTQPLRERLIEIGLTTPIFSGRQHCASPIIRHVEDQPVRKVGYMGIGHEEDLTLVLPALTAYLKKHEQVQFELFGTIPLPAELKSFGDRVRVWPKIENYENFLLELAGYDWDIGLCPLVPNQFNMLKANNKWVEYTAVGTAVIASEGTVYDECCADGCGLLAKTVDDWFSKLDHLTLNPIARAQIAYDAQRRLELDYSVEKLRHQVLDVFQLVRTLRIDSIGFSA
jgi:hypothetical protein